MQSPSSHVFLRLSCLFGLLLLGHIVSQCAPPSNTTAQTPTVDIYPAEGAVAPGTFVTLSTPEKGAQIFYTSDNTRPDIHRGYHYTGAFALWGSSTIRAVAIDAKGQRGPEKQANFTVDTFIPLTQVLPPAGNYAAPIKVTLSTDPQATIFYTQNTTEPTFQSPVYTGPFEITQDTELRFFARSPNGAREVTQIVFYNFPPILRAEPSGGRLYAPAFDFKVFLSTNEKADIEYRILDGTPQTSFQDYQGPVPIQRDTRLAVTAVDQKGARASAVYDYAFARPIENQRTDPLTQLPLATAILDLEGLGNPGFVIAFPDRLSVATPAQLAAGALTHVSSLAFQTRLIRSWDLDGDGLNDILLIDTQGKLHAFRTDSSTQIDPAPELLAPWTSQSEQLVDIIPLDYDNDGQLDILLLDARADQSRLLKRSAKGYTPQKPLSVSVEAGAIGAIAGDFNRDGHTDILLLPGQTRPPNVLYGNGKGEFRRKSLQPFLPTGAIQWLHAARGDLDNDGDLDLFLVGLGPPPPAQPNAPPAPEQVLYVVLLQGLVNEEWKPSSPLILPPTPIRGLLLVDLDNDGYDDLVLLAPPPHPPVLLKNFLGQRLFPLPAPSREGWPTTQLASAANLRPQGAATLALFQTDKAVQLYFQIPLIPTFVYPVFQGIQGNRNSIGAQLVFRTPDYRIRMREIGIRSTGPDQTDLYWPIHFAHPDHIGQLSITWTDGQKRTIPQPNTNQISYISIR